MRRDIYPDGATAALRQHILKDNGSERDEESEMEAAYERIEMDIERYGKWGPRNWTIKDMVDCDLNENPHAMTELAAVLGAGLGYWSLEHRDTPKSAAVELRDRRDKYLAALIRRTIPVDEVNMLADVLAEESDE